MNEAIILAGGFGTRLKNVVSDVPKPMAPVNGQPFLVYLVNYLKHYGVNKIVFSTGYLGEVIEQYFGKEFNNISIEYSLENSPLGTGGGIRLAMNKITGEQCWVLNGDSFFDVDLKKMYQLHENSKVEMSIALRKVPNASRYGCVEVDSVNNITVFNEKSAVTAAGLINGGVYLLNKKYFLTNTIPDTNFSIERDCFPESVKQKQISGFEFNGFFIDIGIPEDYNKAQNDFKKFKY
ncbi:MAG: nucleotidyltransferase family protein [Sphingobacteriaceae bacterium]|nr:nucleotidyltransferase family protein [Sphingobacteriaceae bacterium]